MPGAAKATFDEGIRDVIVLWDDHVNAQRSRKAFRREASKEPNALRQRVLIQRADDQKRKACC